MTESIGWRLEQYTLKRRQEVLMVHLETAICPQAFCFISETCFRAPHGTVQNLKF
jgi:hypothetical protein